ncbi:cytochrome P450 6k1-like [Thrips palmi]|uniref:Cytochrome P450 6k1-like n=1 Tax=Thrips palmi TaxID=161013 RepID=A0A6P8ZB33_THRPL|nr:cytochrome P450 6k1-like [Thrips palmi]
MVDATSVLVAVLAVLVAAALWSRHRQGYWRKRGVPTPPGSLPFIGDMGPIVLGRRSFADHFTDQTRGHRDRGYCGMYMWGQPTLLVFDPEMVKQVVCKDFSSFHDRAPASVSAETDPLSQHLFSITGSKWRNLRNRLSPTFTSGKLKLMFPLMRDISDQLSVTVAGDVKKSGGEVDVALRRASSMNPSGSSCSSSFPSLLDEADGTFPAPLPRPPLMSVDGYVYQILCLSNVMSVNSYMYMRFGYFCKMLCL